MNLIKIFFTFLIFTLISCSNDNITRINSPDNKIDLSVDGWVSVNDILIEEGHAYDYHGGTKKDFKKEIQEEKENKR